MSLRAFILQENKELRGTLHIQRKSLCSRRQYVLLPIGGFNLLPSKRFCLCFVSRVIDS